jgi:hypothetical protein
MNPHEQLQLWREECTLATDQFDLASRSFEELCDRVKRGQIPAAVQEDAMRVARESVGLCRQQVAMEEQKIRALLS